MDASQISGIGGTGANAYVNQAGAAKEATAIETNRQARQQEARLNEKTGPQPLAASGSVGTRIHVTA